MPRLMMILLVGWSALGAAAQLGSDAKACAMTWGEPVSGKLDARGDGVLGYRRANTQVTLHFAEGLAWIAEYRSSELGPAEVAAYLRMNAQGNEWSAWTPAGVAASDLKASMWTRDDEAGMANLANGVLRIRGTRGVRLSERRAAEQKRDAARPVAQVEPGPEAATPAVEARPEPAREKARAARVAPPVPPPDNLPLPGASKAKVVADHGEPSGVMRAGGKEIFVYAWGNVWFSGDTVVEVR